VWLDLLALLVLGAFALWGGVRGALASGVAVGALACGYGAALVASARGGEPLAQALGIPGLAGLALAGTGAFLAGFGAVSVGGGVLVRRERERLGGMPRAPRDRFLGGVFGMLRGGLVVLLLSWAALWVDALRIAGTAAPLPPVAGSAAAAVTGRVVEAGARAALADAGAAGRVAARMAGRPAASLEGLREVFEDGRVAALRDDALFWTYVQSGAVDNAMNRASFVSLERDAELRGRLADLGLVDAEAAEDPAAFREAAGAALAEVGPRLRGLRDDPEVRALLEDPEIAALVNAGDTFGLLTHPELRRVAARVARAGP